MRWQGSYARTFVLFYVTETSGGQHKEPAVANQHYGIELTCDQCGATGSGSASDNDNGPNFSVDTLPASFKHAHYSPNPWKQEFRHDCGGKASYQLT